MFVPQTVNAVVWVPNMQSTAARIREHGSENILLWMSTGNFTLNGPDLIFANRAD